MLTAPSSALWKNCFLTAAFGASGTVLAWPPATEARIDKLASRSSALRAACWTYAIEPACSGGATAAPADTAARLASAFLFAASTAFVQAGAAMIEYSKRGVPQSCLLRQGRPFSLPPLAPRTGSGLWKIVLLRLEGTPSFTRHTVRHSPPRPRTQKCDPFVRSREAVSRLEEP